MPKFIMFAVATATHFLGEVEAETKEEAEAKAEEILDSPALCYHCSINYDLGEPEPLVEEI